CECKCKSNGHSNGNVNANSKATRAGHCMNTNRRISGQRQLAVAADNDKKPTTIKLLVIMATQTMDARVAAYWHSRPNTLTCTELPLDSVETSRRSKRMKMKGTTNGGWRQQHQAFNWLTVDKYWLGSGGDGGGGGSPKSRHIVKPQENRNDQNLSVRPFNDCAVASATAVAVVGAAADKCQQERHEYGRKNVPYRRIKQQFHAININNRPIVCLAYIVCIVSCIVGTIITPILAQDIQALLVNYAGNSHAHNRNRAHSWAPAIPSAAVSNTTTTATIITITTATTTTTEAGETLAIIDSGKHDVPGAMSMVINEDSRLSNDDSSAQQAASNSSEEQLHTMLDAEHVAADDAADATTGPNSEPVTNNESAPRFGYSTLDQKLAFKNSSTTEQQLSIVAKGFTIASYGVVFVVGVVANTLVISVIMRNNKMQTVTDLYILNLAIADEMFLIGVPFLITTMSYGAWTFGKVMCKFTSSLLLTVMSADRYIAVCHPISSPQYRTPYIAKFTCLTVWAVSAILMAPIVIFANTSEENEDPLRAVGPRGQHRSRGKKKSHRKVTQLVFAVIAAYVICWLPYWIGQAYVSFSPADTKHPPLVMAFMLLSGCLSYTNSALNPILYAFLSENFKKRFKRTFTRFLHTQGDSQTGEGTRVHVTNIGNEVSRRHPSIGNAALPTEC
ncbi:Somatostatin receptor type 4, partial [Fragariocoptes setiger]